MQLDVVGGVLRGLRHKPTGVAPPHHRWLYPAAPVVIAIAAIIPSVLVVQHVGNYPVPEQARKGQPVAVLAEEGVQEHRADPLGGDEVAQTGEGQAVTVLAVEQPQPLRYIGHEEVRGAIVGHGFAGTAGPAIELRRRLAHERMGRAQREVAGYGHRYLRGPLIDPRILLGMHEEMDHMLELVGQDRVVSKSARPEHVGVHVEHGPFVAKPIDGSREQITRREVPAHPWKSAVEDREPQPHSVRRQRCAPAAARCLPRRRGPIWRGHATKRRRRSGRTARGGRSRAGALPWP